MIVSELCMLVHERMSLVIARSVRLPGLNRSDPPPFLAPAPPRLAARVTRRGEKLLPPRNHEMLLHLTERSRFSICSRVTRYYLVIARTTYYPQLLFTFGCVSVKPSNRAARGSSSAASAFFGFWQIPLFLNIFLGNTRNDSLRDSGQVRHFSTYKGAPPHSVVSRSIRPGTAKKSHMSWSLYSFRSSPLADDVERPRTGRRRNGKGHARRTCG